MEHFDFKTNIIRDLKSVGIDALVEDIENDLFGSWTVIVTFENGSDLNLYKLTGEYGMDKNVLMAVKK